MYVDPFKKKIKNETETVFSIQTRETELSEIFWAK